MNNRYVRGQMVRLIGTYKDIAGVLIDPTTVRVKYRAPGAVVATTLTYGVDAAVVKDSTGVYHCDVDTTSAYGTWRYRWEGAGTAQPADERQFVVDASALD